MKSSMFNLDKNEYQVFNIMEKVSYPLKDLKLTSYNERS